MQFNCNAPISWFIGHSDTQTVYRSVYAETHNVVSWISLSGRNLTDGHEFSYHGSRNFAAHIKMLL